MSRMRFDWFPCTKYPKGVAATHETRGVGSRGGGLGRPETGKTCCLALALTLALALAPGTGNSSLLGSFSLGGCANILIKFSPWQLSLHQSAAATAKAAAQLLCSFSISPSLSHSFLLPSHACSVCLAVWQLPVYCRQPEHISCFCLKHVLLHSITINIIIIVISSDCL